MRLPHPTPAAFPDLVTREVQVNGRRVVYTEAGEGPTLLLLHGAVFAGNVFWWETQQALAPFARTIAPDFVGWGDSEKPPGDYGLERYDAFVLDFMDALGLDRVPIVGHSMGGLIGSAFALLHPERVSQLAMLAVPPCWGDFGLPRIFQPFAWPLVGELMLAISPWLSTEHPFGVRRSYESLILKPEALPVGRFTEVLEFCRQLTGDPAHRRAFLSSMRSTEVLFTPAERVRFRELARESQVPMLLLAGRQDPMFPLPLIEAAAPMCPAARLVVLDECGHFPNWEQPDQVIDWIKDFCLPTDRALAL